MSTSRHRRFPSVITAILVVAGIAFPRLATAELPFTHFTPESGPARLPSSSVQKISQDRLGYIWMGFFSTGLGRYNGHAVTTWSVADGLGDLTVRDFIEDASGRLWVTSETGVVASEKPLGEVTPKDRIHFTTKFGATPLPDERMGRNQMALLPDGRLVIATRKGVEAYRFSADGSLAHTMLDSKGEGEAGILAGGQGGAFWIAFVNGSFGRGEPGSDGIAAWRDPSLSATLVSTLFERVPGELWAGTVSGELYRRRGEGQVFELVSKELTERVSAITAVGSDLWVASLGSGVLRLDLAAPAAPVHIRRADGLLSDTVWSIAPDREGSLWFAQNGGVSRLRSDYRAFTTLTASRRNDEAPALPAPECFGVVAPSSADGVGSWTWIATAGGVAVRDRNGRVAVVGPKDGLLSGSVYTLARDRSGRIWVGTAAGLNAIVLEGDAALGGLTTEQPLEILGKKATIVSFIALEPERIYSCRALEVSDGANSISTVFTAGSSGVHCLIDGEWIALESDTGKAAAYDVAIGPLGHLWVATPQKGVMRSSGVVSAKSLRARLTGETANGTTLYSVWDRAKGAGSNHFRALAVAGDQVWAGAAGSVAVFNAATFETDPKPRVLAAGAGLGDSIIASIAKAPSGSVWVSQGRGVSEVDPATLSVKRRLGRRDGLIDGEVWGPGAVAFSFDGKLHAATPRGVSIVDVSALSTDSHPPVLRMERAEIKPPEKGRSAVALEWSALSYRNEEATRFRTRLLGFDDRWSEWSPAASVRFSSIPASSASYTLEVDACGADGICTDAPLKYEFSVAK